MSEAISKKRCSQNSALKQCKIKLEVEDFIVG